MHKQTVLVTGGAGYIGSQVVEKLLEENYKVRIYDTFLYSKEIFKNIRQKKNLEFVIGDIRDKFTLTSAFRDISAVVHLAGIVGDLACSLNEEHAKLVNVEGTKNVRDIAKKHKIERFIFASSCSVYGVTKRLVNEKSRTNPLALYARTKLESEKDLLEAASSTFHPTILRFSTVFGHSRRQRFDLVANLFTYHAFTNSNITVNGGNQWRPFIHVKDIAQAIYLILESPIDLVDREIFNVGDDKNHFRIKDLAYVVKRIVARNKKLTITHMTENPDKRNYRVSFKKINQILGFKANISIEEGLQEIYVNLQKNAYTEKNIRSML